MRKAIVLTIIIHKTVSGMCFVKCWRPLCDVFYTEMGQVSKRVRKKRKYERQMKSIHSYYVFQPHNLSVVSSHTHVLVEARHIFSDKQLTFPDRMCKESSSSSHLAFLCPFSFCFAFFLIFLSFSLSLFPCPNSLALSLARSLFFSSILL